MEKYSSNDLTKYFIRPSSIIICIALFTGCPRTISKNLVSKAAPKVPLAPIVRSRQVPQSNRVNRVASEIADDSVKLNTKRKIQSHIESGYNQNTLSPKLFKTGSNLDGSENYVYISPNSKQSDEIGNINKQINEALESNRSSADKGKISRVAIDNAPCLTDNFDQSEWVVASLQFTNSDVGWLQTKKPCYSGWKMAPNELKEIRSERGKMLGEKATRFDGSRTIDKKINVRSTSEDAWRLDIEAYPNKPANIHLQPASGTSPKLYFDPVNKALYVRNLSTGKFELASKNYQNLLAELGIQNAINKGLSYIGEPIVTF